MHFQTLEFYPKSGDCLKIIALSKNFKYLDSEKDLLEIKKNDSEEMMLNSHLSKKCYLGYKFCQKYEVYPN